MFQNLIRIAGIGLIVASLTSGIGYAAGGDPVYQPESGKPVHYNWGLGAPKSFPVDHFSAEFDQSKTYAAGDYFIQTFADDGVKVEADGSSLINRWSDSSGVTNRSLWLGVTEGEHQIKTSYFENEGSAFVYSDVVPFDSWLAYYYTNKDLKGAPSAAKVFAPVGDLKKLSEDSGQGSPASGIPVDGFSAKYTTVKHIVAGDYILRTRADDGVRIKIDGQTVFNRWTAGSYKEDAVKVQIKDNAGANPDVHTVEVEYYEDKGDSRLEFFLEPYENAAGDGWLGEIYPNASFQGTPVILGGENSTAKLSKLNLNWGNNSPQSSIPKDHFTGRFTKKETFDEGMYMFEAHSDDGIRVWVDNKPVIDSWKNGSSKTLRKGKTYLDKGEHTIRVDYFENTGEANLSLNYYPFSKMPEQTTGTVHYNWGTGSPASGIPADHFTASFDQSKTFSAGDYFVQTLADDGVKVEADGKDLINRWGDSSGVIDRALWLGVTGEPHQVKTDYYENEGSAFIFSDVVPFDSWLAYYYPNKDLQGTPVTSKVLAPVGDLKKLSEDSGQGSPASGIPVDGFSARYTTVKHIVAGDYILRTRADDGVRIKIDGQTVFNRWTAGSYKEDAVKVQIKDNAGANPDVHTVEVEYYEDKGDSRLEFFLEPYENAKGDGWLEEIYPNLNFQGNPYILGGKNSSNEISDLNLDWGKGAPISLAPSDNFSVRFTKQASLETGTYVFSTKADDSVKVLVDGKTVVDTGENYKVNTLLKGAVYVEAGVHEITVEYKEEGGYANVSLDYTKIDNQNIFYQFGKNVSFNWGTQSPNETLPGDNFEALFDQSGTYSAGDYFVQTLADDGVKVEADGKSLINRWSDSSGVMDRGLWLGVSGGQHDVETRYYENGGSSAIFSNVVPLDTWVSYYYPNQDLSGLPTSSKVINPVGNSKELYENMGSGGPAAGFKTDDFSARYVTAKRLPAGDYVLRVKADDGVRVLVDGKTIMDRWSAGSFREDAVQFNVKDNETGDTNAKSVHWIEVQYYEGLGNAAIEANIQTLSDAQNTSDWIGYVYPNKTLSGEPVILGGTGAQTSIKDINYNWNEGSPSSLIPSDGFSARFVKKVSLNTGVYKFESWSDDGIRVYVDNNLVIDSWVNSSTDYKDSIQELAKGTHTITVEYYDDKSLAELKFNLENITSQNPRFVSNSKLPVYRSFDELSQYQQHLVYYNPNYTRFDTLSFGDVVYVLDQKLYASKISTPDGKIGWVQTAYLDENLTDDWWLVKEGRTLRSSSSASSSNIGFVPDKSKVRVIDYVSTNDTYSDWYYIQTESGQKGWIWGAISNALTKNSISGETYQDSGMNLIKYEFDKVGKTTNQVSIFTPLNTKANVTADQINRFIDSKTGGKKTAMSGQGSAFITAQNQSGLNAIYLLAHAGLETGWGNSTIVKSKYNFYGIGAIDSQPAQGAYNFDSPSGGIIAGAIWISNNYVIRSWDINDTIPFYQPTLDNMRYDNSYHQYSTDESWPVKIAQFAQDFYNFIN